MMNYLFLKYSAVVAEGNSCLLIDLSFLMFFFPPVVWYSMDARACFVEIQQECVTAWWENSYDRMLTKCVWKL